MVRRALLIVHRAAAGGHDESRASALRSQLEDLLPSSIRKCVQLAPNHAAVRESVAGFLAESDEPALVIAGGGGGTLRGVIEAICAPAGGGALPQSNRVRITPLRLGSGNVLAKQFGIPAGTRDALRGIAANLASNRTAPCCIVRVEAGQRDATPQIHYAATLAGFGELGRVPSDLARCHKRFPRLHRLLARWSAERLTRIEYPVSVLLRLFACGWNPGRLDQIEIRTASHAATLRLFAGALMNFRVSGLPFDPGIRAEESALAFHAVAYDRFLPALRLLLSPRRARAAAARFEISPGDRLEILLKNRETADFFLDEDPMTFHRSLTAQVVGTLAFVPGPLYRERG